MAEKDNREYILKLILMSWDQPVICNREIRMSAFHYINVSKQKSLDQKIKQQNDGQMGRPLRNFKVSSSTNLTLCDIDLCAQWVWHFVWLYDGAVVIVGSRRSINS